MEMYILVNLIFVCVFSQLVSSFTFYERREIPNRKIGNSKASLIHLLMAEHNLIQSIAETIKAEKYLIKNVLSNQDKPHPYGQYESVMPVIRQRYPKRKRNNMHRRDWRVKRSFDSISHRGGGLERLNVENHHQRLLEELIRQEQERLRELQSAQTSVPDIFESVFPILHRNIRRP